jgi:hypothetical protein
MNTRDIDPLHRIAERVADCFAESGYAFVEDDKIDVLAELLGMFLTDAGIRVNPPGRAAPESGGSIPDAVRQNRVVGGGRERGVQESVPDQAE